MRDAGTEGNGDTPPDAMVLFSSYFGYLYGIVTTGLVVSVVEQGGREKCWVVCLRNPRGFSFKEGMRDGEGRGTGFSQELIYVSMGKLKRSTDSKQNERRGRLPKQKHCILVNKWLSQS